MLCLLSFCPPTLVGGTPSSPQMLCLLPLPPWQVRQGTPSLPALESSSPSPLWTPRWRGAAPTSPGRDGGEGVGCDLLSLVCTAVLSFLPSSPGSDDEEEEEGEWWVMVMMQQQQGASTAPRWLELEGWGGDRRGSRKISSGWRGSERGFRNLQSDSQPSSSSSPVACRATAALIDAREGRDRDKARAQALLRAPSLGEARAGRSAEGGGRMMARAPSPAGDPGPPPKK